jgi:hypothetical protein
MILTGFSMLYKKNFIKITLLFFWISMLIISSSLVDRNIINKANADTAM